MGKVALDMLDNIRVDLRSYLPKFHWAEISVERSLECQISELPGVASPNEMSSTDVDFSLISVPARLECIRDGVNVRNWGTTNKRLRDIISHVWPGQMAPLQTGERVGSNCLLYPR